MAPDGRRVGTRPGERSEPAECRDKTILGFHCSARSEKAIEVQQSVLSVKKCSSDLGSPSRLSRPASKGKMAASMGARRVAGQPAARPGCPARATHSAARRCAAPPPVLSAARRRGALRRCRAEPEVRCGGAAATRLRAVERCTPEGGGLGGGLQTRRLHPRTTNARARRPRAAARLAPARRRRLRPRRPRPPAALAPMAAPPRRPGAGPAAVAAAWGRLPLRVRNGLTCRYPRCGPDIPNPDPGRDGAEVAGSGGPGPSAGGRRFQCARDTARAVLAPSPSRQPRLPPPAGGG
jgi:hypothetical protein